MSEIRSLNSASLATLSALASGVLEDGGIVAFPTETVYGLAVRGDDPAAVERLFRVKGRPAQKPFATYVSEVAAVPGAARSLPREFTKLARAFWPGPVTIVLQDEDGSTEGFRCSSHAFVQAWTRATKVPIVGTSANLSGSAVLTDAEAIGQVFARDVALVIDGGTIADRPPSTVVKVTRRGEWQVLREGSVATAIIAEELRFRVLIVCSGNTCRSPMAQASLPGLLAASGRDPGRFEIWTAGTSAARGEPASEEATAVMLERGLDLQRHRSRPLTAELLDRMDLVLTMSTRHSDAVTGRDRDGTVRIVTLAENSGGIDDPFGGDREVYRECSEQIDAALCAALAQGCFDSRSR